MPTPRRSNRVQALLAGTVAGMAVAAAAAALRRLDAVEVEGRSMAPALLPGDRLLVESWTFRRRAPRPGEVVLAGDPRSPSRELTKRVAAVRDGTIDLRGDLPTSSTDSRHFGPVAALTVRWRVAARYWPPSRAGLIRHAARTSAPLELQPLGGEPACTAFGELVVGADGGR